MATVPSSSAESPTATSTSSQEKQEQASSAAPPQRRQPTSRDAYVLALKVSLVRVWVHLNNKNMRVHHLELTQSLADNAAHRPDEGPAGASKEAVRSAEPAPRYRRRSRGGSDTVSE